MLSMTSQFYDVTALVLDDALLLILFDIKTQLYGKYIRVCERRKDVDWLLQEHNNIDIFTGKCRFRTMSVCRAICYCSCYHVVGLLA